MRSAALRTPAAFVAIALLTLTGVATPAPASAASATAPGHDRLVRHYPASATPAIADGRVYAILDLGSKVVVGGSFTKVASKGSSTQLTRRYAFAFDKATGAVDAGFRPQLDGEVRALLAGPASGQVFLAGQFRLLNGAARRGLALVSAGTGARVTTFNPPVINGPVYDLAAHPNGSLLIGGTFTKVGAASRGGLASVRRDTGALTSFLAVRLAGHHNWDGDGAKAAVGVVRFALAPNAGRLAVVGNFRTAGGLDRDQAVVINTSGATASVSGWRTDGFRSTCNSNSFDTWVRDVAYAPDSSYFVVVTTGGLYPGLCDTATRWPVGGGLHQPTWVAHSGGDTFLSVTVTERAVYVGGHIRWLNNPLGRDAARAGAVGRASIAALDPANGLPYAWNPGRNPRGYGVTELYATPSGLWLGYDTAYLGNFQWRRERIGFFPLRGGAPVPAATAANLPGRVYVGGEGASSTLVRRLYAGAGEVGQDESTPEAGMDWSRVRGGFWVGGTVYFGTTDGYLYRRGFDGGSWEAIRRIDPYHDNDGVAPDWDTVSHGRNGTYAGANPDFYGTELTTVTGMGYTAGRLYYTRVGSSALYWRWFSPATGTVGAQRFQAASSGFGDVAGALFVAGGHLYVSRVDGALYRMSFSGGVPSGTQTKVSGPGIDSHSWRARAIFPAP
ncbi:MAG: hypothetical protein ACRDT6_21265 [Micromonosporaceae bacterium]